MRRSVSSFLERVQTRRGRTQVAIALSSQQLIRGHGPLRSPDNTPRGDLSRTAAAWFKPWACPDVARVQIAAMAS